MQPYKRNISHDRYSQTNRRSDLTVGSPACRRTHRNLLYSYSRGWCKPKSKGTNFRLIVEMFVTIAEVQYLYPRLDSSYGRTSLVTNLEKKTKLSKLRSLKPQFFPSMKSDASSCFISCRPCQWDPFLSDDDIIPFNRF
jgi:hypothetical protein